MPVVNGLEGQFGTQIDFIHLNIDTDAEFAVAEEYEMYRRSQYTLIDANGTIIKSWFGRLSEEQLTADLEAILAELAD